MDLSSSVMGSVLVVRQEEEEEEGVEMEEEDEEDSTVGDGFSVEDVVVNMSGGGSEGVVCDVVTGG